MLAEEQQIKGKIVSIIKTYRSLSFLANSEVKINDLADDGANYVVRGDYDYTNIFGQAIEKGSFEITLRKPDLTQVNTKVTPQQ